jgi:hypothetical protein
MGNEADGALQPGAAEKEFLEAPFISAGDDFE